MPELTSQLRARQQAHFLVVDEGPGISGSSLAGTAAMLRSWGIADDRILLFPSWRTDGFNLQSTTARDNWSRHPQFIASFEEVWLESGRLHDEFQGELRDVSAGEWRREVYSSPELYPPVQPQHERRKYLLTRPAAGRESPGLLSFIGLGEATRRKVCRAESIANAGFTPRPERIAHGFMLRPFVAGYPVRPGTADAELMNVVAAYLAHLCLEHRTEPSVSDSSLREMIALNTAEGLPDSPAEDLLRHFPADGWVERPVALDGRMLSHEWIRTSTGYTKVDAVDHHDDHFFPGCQDIAWDISAAGIELGLAKEERRYLVDRYRVLSGDKTIAARIRPYTIAYLAFRLGYTSMAATVLGDTADATRFSREARRYARLLGRELGVPAKELGGARTGHL